jgi:hypothetical protein
MEYGIAALVYCIVIGLILAFFGLNEDEYCR